MKRLRKVVPWFGLIVAGALLVTHVLGLGSLKVDSTTLVLLGLFLLVPYLDVIRKIKIGDFEAEIESREIQKVVSKAGTELGLGAVVDEDVNENEVSLRKLVQQDPQLALAKLRIELERSLNAIHRVGNRSDTSRRPMGVGRLVRELEEQDRLPQEIGGAIRDVLPLANRAVHGESVQTDDALQLVGLGVRLLRELHEVLADLVVGPEDSRPISKEEEVAYSSATYRVTTVTPLVDRPVKNTRTLDQEGLDLLLEGYEEYAEYIVGVERLEKDGVENEP